jgi:tetratricopeptide (TPR) repeat protein
LRTPFVKAVAAVLAAFALASVSRIAAAQEQKEDSGKREAPVIDQTTGKKMSDAIEALNAGKYADAKALLSKINLDKLSPYERSRIEQIYASISQAEGDYAGVLKHIQAAIASGGLNEQEVSAAKYQLAQVAIAQEKWQEGLNALKEWFATAQNPNGAAYYLMAVAYYQLKDYKNAIPAAEKAIELSDKPQESWLQLLLALRLQQDQYAEALPILKRLLAASPDKKSYWLQLSAVNSELQKYDEAVSAMEIAYRGGILTEDGEIRRLSELLLYVGIPYRAATTLQKAIEDDKVKGDKKTYETLANCWIAAREYDKATQPLAQAASLHENGDLYVRLAEVFMQREKWPEAQDALQHALDKGKLKDTGNTKLLMGIAVYSQDKPKEARTWFQQASEYANEKKAALGWLQHIDSEQNSGR